MSRLAGVAGATSILALLLAAAPGRAEPTYYTYTGSASPNPVGTADNISYNAANGQGLQFFSAPGGHYFVTPIATSVSSGSLVSMFPINHDPDPSSITFDNVHFTLTMDLRQFNPFVEARETYHGILRGTVGYATHISSLVADIVDSAPRNLYFGPIRYYFVVDYEHRITWDPLAVFPGNNTPGNFRGDIDARFYLGRAPAHPPASTPEPSGLALAGIGLACAAGAAIRRKLRTLSPT
jgi:hypothetical protein